MRQKKHMIKTIIPLSRIAEALGMPEGSEIIHIGTDYLYVGLVDMVVCHESLPEWDLFRVPSSRFNWPAPGTDEDQRTDEEGGDA